jgi:4-hydroxybenzoate polyprenyltransferase
VKDLNEEKEFTLGQRLWGHFILTRPQQLIWLDVFASLAFFAIVVRGVPTLHFFLFVGCAVICDAGACTINDVGDVESDCKSKETSRCKRPLCIGSVTKKAAMSQGLFLYAIGLMIAFFLDFYMFLAVLALVFISYEYSMKPLKLDAKPVYSQAFWISFALLDYAALVLYLTRYVRLPPPLILDLNLLQRLLLHSQY